MHEIFTQMAEERDAAKVAWWDEMPRLGEAEVRKRLALGELNSDQGDLAEHWLAIVDRDREDRRAVDHLRVTRQARTAAWCAAIAAAIGVVLSIVLAFFA